mgnify:FL=1
MLGYHSMDNIRVKKKVVMHEANQTEIDVKQNTVDIMAMKNDLTEIKTNQKHLDGQIEKIDKKVEKIDGRLWAIMLLVVGSAIANYWM